MAFKICHAEQHFQEMCAKARRMKNRRVFIVDHLGNASVVIHARCARASEAVIDVEYDVVETFMDRFVVLVQAGNKFRVSLPDGRSVILRRHTRWVDPLTMRVPGINNHGVLDEILETVRELSSSFAEFRTASDERFEQISGEFERQEKIMRRIDLGYDPNSERLGLYQAQRAGR